MTSQGSETRYEEEKSKGPAGFSLKSARDEEAVLAATSMVNAAFDKGTQIEANQSTEDIVARGRGQASQPSHDQDTPGDDDFPVRAPADSPSPPPNLPPSPLVTPPVGAQQTPSSPQSHSSYTSKSMTPIAPKRGVPHVYHDYSHTPDMPGYVRKKTGGVTQPFPEKLHEMLDTETDSETQSIVSWLPHGRAFIVRKPKVFTKEIMPK
jgi:hypothetical protein